MLSRLERLANKEEINEGYYLFVPELDFGLTNQMAYIKNKIMSRIPLEKC